MEERRTGGEEGKRRDGEMGREGGEDRRKEGEMGREGGKEGTWAGGEGRWGEEEGRKGGGEGRHHGACLGSTGAKQGDGGGGGLGSGCTPQKGPKWPQNVLEESRKWELWDGSRRGSRGQNGTKGGNGQEEPGGLSHGATPKPAPHSVCHPKGGAPKDSGP